MLQTYTCDSALSGRARRRSAARSGDYVIAAINDSLALKAGVVGIAMGAGGSDIALASADVVLIGSDLRRLGTCVRLSRRCRRTLQVNVIVGLGWTVAIVVCAAFGLLGAAGATVAAVLHNLSTLLVLANAGRLLRFDEPLLRAKKSGTARSPKS